MGSTPFYTSWKSTDNLLIPGKKQFYPGKFQIVEELKTSNFSDIKLLRFVTPSFDDTVAYKHPSDPIKFSSAAIYNNQVDSQAKKMVSLSWDHMSFLFRSSIWKFHLWFQGEISIKMRIKTSEPTGTLLFMANHDESHYLKLSVRYSYLVLHLKMDSEVDIELESIYLVAENEWKEIEVIFLFWF